jgi:hypothetical protein
VSPGAAPGRCVRQTPPLSTSPGDAPVLTVLFRNVCRRLAPVYLERRVQVYGAVAHFELRPLQRQAEFIFQEESAAARAAAASALHHRPFGTRILSARPVGAAGEERGAFGDYSGCAAAAPRAHAARRRRRPS